MMRDRIREAGYWRQVTMWDAITVYNAGLLKKLVLLRLAPIEAEMRRPCRRLQTPAAVDELQRKAGSGCWDIYNC